MDAGFDMHTTFSEQKSRSNISMLLKSVNLEKYVELIMKSGIDYHTFVNMNREDMRRIGIINNRDQDALLAIMQPLLAMYHELEPRPIKWGKILANTRSMAKIMAGVLVQLRNDMSSPGLKVKDSLVDLETPGSAAFDHLLDLIDSRVDLIREDLRSILEKQEEFKKKKRTKVKIAASGVIVLATAAGLFLWSRHLRISLFK